MSLLFVILHCCTLLRAATVLVDPEGKDTATCGTIEEPCQTIEFALSKYIDDSTITVNGGDYTPVAGLDLNTRKHISLLGQGMLTTVTHPIAIDDALFRVDACENITIGDMMLLFSKVSAVYVTGDSQSITLTNLILGRNTGADWNTPFVIDACNDVKILLEENITLRSPQWDPASASNSPYLIKATGVQNITVASSVTDGFSTFTIPHLGLLSALDCDNATIAKIKFGTHCGSKIFTNTTKTVTLNDLQFNHEAPPTNSNSANEALNVLHEVQRELLRSNADAAELSYTPTAVYIANSDLLTVTDCLFSQLHTGGLDVDVGKTLTMTNTNFTGNVLGYSPSLNRQAPAGADPSYGGTGCSCTIRDMDTVTVTNSHFEFNSVSYENWAPLTSAKSSPVYSQIVGLVSQITSFGEPVSHGIFEVSADLWIADVKVSLSFDGNFNHDHMSYDSIDTTDPSKSFIVPEFAFKAPTTSNLIRSRSPRPSACLFITRCPGKVTFATLNASDVEGTLAVVHNSNDVSASKINIDKVTTQSNVFSESAIYITRQLTADNAPTGTVNIEDSTISGIIPSPIANEPVVVGANENEGWQIPSGGRTGYNTRRASGGAICIEGYQTIRVKKTIIIGSVSNGEGGAISIIDAADIGLNNLYVESAVARGGCGGGILISSEFLTTLTMESTVTKYCTAAVKGGGFFVPILSSVDSIAITAKGCTCESCVASEGGGLFIGTRENEEPLATGPVATFTVELTSWKFLGCTASYGAGFYLGSIQHVTAINMTECTASDCVSFISGGGGFISAAMHHVNWTIDGLSTSLFPSLASSAFESPNAEPVHLLVERSHFIKNKALGAGGGLFTHIIPYESAVTPKERLPSFAFIGTEFVENQCFGSAAGWRAGMVGGGGLAQIVCDETNHTDPPTPASALYANQEAKTNYNTQLTGCTFRSNIGGGYMAYEKVVALLSNNNFFTNKARLPSASGTLDIPLNIECARSSLNVADTNIFSTSANAAAEPYYSCDKQCESFTETTIKCWAPIPQEPTTTKMEPLNKRKYPVLPQLKFSKIPVLAPTNPLIFVTTALNVTPPAVDTLNQMLSIQPYLSYDSIYIARPSSDRANTTYVRVPASRSLRHINLDADAAPTQVVPATSTLDKDLTTATISSIKTSVTLVGFPTKAPANLTFFATADGLHWSKGIEVPLVNVLDDDEKKSWGWYSFIIMIAFVGLWGVIVACIACIQSCVDRSRKRQGYSEIGSNYLVPTEAHPM